MGEVRRAQDQTKQAVTSVQTEMRQGFAKMHQSLNRLNQRPTARRSNAVPVNNPVVADDGGLDVNAILSHGPKTLHALWEEWTTGIGGMKPARLFTQRERGRVRFVYSKRKIFWDKVSQMVRSGMLADVATDKIHEACGESLAVTAILREMQKDKPRGGHPGLRV